MDHTARKGEIAGLFDRIAPSYDQVGPAWFAQFGRRLVELAQITPGSAVLDVAAGRGANLFAAAEQVGEHGRLIGIDISEEMVRETTRESRRRGLRNVEMRRMDAERLELPDASFDRVLCGFALFFFHLELALPEFHRVLKPGGLMLASTWGERDPRWSWYSELLEAYGLAEPNLTMQPLDKPDELEEAFASAGFVQVSVVEEEFDITYKDEEEWWARLLAHGPGAVLEEMEPDRLAGFKAEAFKRMQPYKQPDGIHRLFRVLFTAASKPGGTPLA